MEGKARLTKTRNSDRDRFDQMLIEEFLAPPDAIGDRRRPIPIKVHGFDRPGNAWTTLSETDSPSLDLAWSPSEPSRHVPGRGTNQPVDRSNDADPAEVNPPAQHGPATPIMTKPPPIPEITPPLFSVRPARQRTQFSVLRFLLSLGSGLLVGGLLLSTFR